MTFLKKSYVNGLKANFSDLPLSEEPEFFLYCNKIFNNPIQN
jgi:hypothetical protein